MRGKLNSMIVQQFIRELEKLLWKINSKCKQRILINIKSLKEQSMMDKAIVFYYLWHDISSYENEELDH